MKRIGFIDGRRIGGWAFPATAVPGNGQVMTVRDPSTPVGGTIRGKYLNYIATGNKTGSPTTVADAVSLAISGDSKYAYGRSTYVKVDEDAIINYLSGHFVYLDDIGALASVNRMCALDLGVNVTNAPNINSTFMRAYSHGGPVQSLVWIPSSQGITYLFDFEQGVTPVLGPSTPGAAVLTNWIPVPCRRSGSPWFMIMAKNIA